MVFKKPRSEAQISLHIVNFKQIRSLPTCSTNSPKTMVLSSMTIGSCDPVIAKFSKFVALE